MIRTIALMMALATGLTSGAAAAQSGDTSCRHDESADYREHGPGPFKLARMECRNWPRSASGPVAVSPDGRSVAAYATAEGIFVSSIGGAMRHVDADPKSAGWFHGTFGDPRGAFAWDSGSQGLWAVSQQALKPSGWPTEPLETWKAGSDGTLTPLPRLSHPAGPLDGIYWIGGDGLALAQFGTRGEYYRPVREDRDPTLALVDAASGKILDTVPFGLLTGGIELKFSARSYLQRIAAVLLPDGRVRTAVLTPQGWTIWTQGEAPRFVPKPFTGLIDIALSPDGSALLVRLQLHNGSVCPHVGPCHPGPLVKGPIAQLIALDTGTPRWTLQGEGVWGNGNGPVRFSPSGRHALVPLPPGESQAVAVVSTADGRIVQKLARRYGWGSGAGFTEGGQLWVANGDVIAFYDLKE